MYHYTRIVCLCWLLVVTNDVSCLLLLKQYYLILIEPSVIRIPSTIMLSVRCFKSDYEHVKPFPDPYLKALEVLQVSKDHVVIFEKLSKSRRNILMTAVALSTIELKVV